MLRSHSLVAFTSVALLALAATACGSVDQTKSTTGTGGGSSATGMTTGTGGAAPIDDIVPPLAPPPMAPDGADTVTFAVKKLYLGDTDRKGSTATSSTDWRNYGYDLDHRISTGSSTDLCKPHQGASAKVVYPDGTKGIDNSFGKNILGLILGISPDASVKINESITKGSFTLMLSMQKLGMGSDYNPLLARLYGGAKLATPPLFDGTDKWPVLDAFVKDPADITSAKVQFDQSYVVKNTWVSGTNATFDLGLAILGFDLKLTIANAVITMDLDADHKGATNGTIAGVIATETLTTQLKKVAGAFDPTLCSGTTIDGIVTSIEQASDILQDGTQDPTKECDGISIGLGFDAAVVKLGDVVPAPSGTGDPCATMMP